MDVDRRIAGLRNLHRVCGAVGRSASAAPCTTTLGARICLADLTQVFVLNMTYDIGVKQISFHLALLSLLLLAPDFRRLANFFFLDRPADRSTQPQLFRSPVR